MEYCNRSGRSRKVKFYFFITICFAVVSSFAHGQVYSGEKGKVKLIGEAPQETITAESSTLVGKLDVNSRKFNFKQPMNMFTYSQGEVQKKHAEENYFKVKEFPNATFTGQIINDVNLQKDGVYHVTALGVFRLHGIEKNVKIPAAIKVHDGKIEITSTFTVYLSDHEIKIPNLMSLKVSEEFNVDLSLKMTKVNL